MSRFPYAIWLLLAFFLSLPYVPAFLASGQAYAPMDETKHVRLAEDLSLSEGLMSHVYGERPAHRSHFTGLWLDTLWAHVTHSPQGFRFFRWLEIFLFFFAIIYLFQYFVPFSLPVYFFVLSLFSLSLVRPLFFISFYELEGTLFTVLGSALLLASSRVRALILPVFLLLCFSKESFVPIAILLLAWRVLERLLGGLKLKISWIALFTLLLGVLIFVLQDKGKGYSARYEIGFFQTLTEIFDWLTGIGSSPVLATAFFIAIALGLIAAFFYSFKTRQGRVLRESLFWIGLGLTYFLILFPWAGRDRHAYYYYASFWYFKIGACFLLLMASQYMRDMQNKKICSGLSLLLVLFGLSRQAQTTQDVNLYIVDRKQQLTLAQALTESYARTERPIIFIACQKSDTLEYPGRLADSARYLLEDSKSFPFETIRDFTTVPPCFSGNQCPILVFQHSEYIGPLKQLLLKEPGARYFYFDGFEIFSKDPEFTVK